MNICRNLERAIISEFNKEGMIIVPGNATGAMINAAKKFYPELTDEQIDFIYLAMTNAWLTRHNRAKLGE